MLVDVEHPAVESVVQSSGANRSRARSPDVICRGVSEIDARPPGVLGAQRKVEILEVDEEPLIESVELLKHGTTDKEKCARHVVHLARVVVIPLRHEVAREGWTRRLSNPNILRRI